MNGAMNGAVNRGRILVVGIGPGAVEHMTLRARSAIEEADVVIGYATYVQLLGDLVAGKQVIKKGMTQEADRCAAALEQAEAGKRVALISSGDAGVYGMASLTFEVLFASGWSPASGVGVEVIPGCTALASCGSLVGAPLGHDLCSVSLSDLLTPWPVIARRLEAAARADFVLALYNPKSGRRAGQIVAARDILLRFRDPATPVAIVRSAYRPKQSIELTTLAEMADCDIGMLSTVLVGNGDSFIRDGLMVTPRGYGAKYQGLTGAAAPGEKRGHSLALGLEGWPRAVVAWLRGHPQAGPEAAAAHFDRPVAEILAAVVAAARAGNTGEAAEIGAAAEIGEAGENGEASESEKRGETDFEASALASTLLAALPGLLVAAFEIRLRRAGMTLRCRMESLAFDAERLVLRGFGGEATVARRAVAGIWAWRRQGAREIYFTDGGGAALLVLGGVDPALDLGPFHLSA